MNLLGLVFSLLLILTYGFYSTWDKQSTSARLRSTYIGHQKVNRKLLNSYQSEIYSSFRYKPKDPKIEEDAHVLLVTEKPRPAIKKLDPNRMCAKINLWPLIQEGREKHPLLYNYTAKLIATFYASHFKSTKQFERTLLDALLSAAKEQKEAIFSLEKLDLANPDLQRIYYKMLKGTKQGNQATETGYPSLLDYFKIENSNEKICLFHAHPNLISIFFGPQVADSLYREIHKENGAVLTRELIEKACLEAHIIGLDPEIFALLELGKPYHEEQKKTLIAEDKDSQVILRRSFYVKGPTS